LSGEISDYIEEVYLPDDCFVLVKINAKRVRLLQLEISMQSVCDAIRNAKLPVSIKVDQVRIVGKSTLCIRPTVSKISKLMCIQYLKYNLDRVVVKGRTYLE
jgi:DNA-directed RNA polymerase III subunit RPC1